MKNYNFIRNRGVVFKQAATMAAMSLLTIALIVGCLTAYGKAVRSDEASATFNQFKFVEGYNYYYLGFDTNPWAILGLDSNITLDTGKIWKPLDPDSDKLKGMVSEMNRSHSCTGPSKRRSTGYSVVDEKNATIGLIYSCYTWFPVKTVSENKVSITCPGMYESSVEY